MGDDPFRGRRSDTLVETIEREYRINLNARAGTTLGNLLRARRFNSLTQLLQAYWGRLKRTANPRKVFLSFHREDLRQVAGFRLMMLNEHVALDVSDEPNRTPVGSERSSYVKQVLRSRIADVDVVVCMIGNGTAWRDWVRWELETAVELHRGVCGVKLKGSRPQIPPILREIGVPIAHWEPQAIIAAIECAAARRS